MWEIYKKEFLELVRDKRTLIFTVLLPTIIMPLILGAVVLVTVKMSQKAEKEQLTYVVQNAAVAPRVVEELAKQSNLKLIEMDGLESATAQDFKQAIKDKVIKFALVLPMDTPQKLQQGEQVEIELHFNDASVTNKIYQRVKAAIETISEEQQTVLLQQFNLSESKLKGLTKPISILRVNTADNREDKGEKIGWILPYMLIILILSGAMYPALDMGVGEKERGTLETLLLTPVSRTKIVIAKFFVIFSTGFLTVFLTLLSLTVWGLLAGQFMAIEALKKISEIVQFTDIALIFLMLAPIAAIFASLLLCASIYAKNFKEAQNYMSPIMTFAFVPIIFSILPGVQLDSTWAWVPLTNVSLAIKEIIKGTVDYAMLGIIFLSTTLVAGALLYFCTRWFNKESVLFRT